MIPPESRLDIQWRKDLLGGDVVSLEIEGPPGALEAELRAAEWVKTARRQAPSESAWAGLLPAAVADGEYLWDGKHHIVGYDFWNLRGLLCVADAARALGEPAFSDHHKTFKDLGLTSLMLVEIR